jgi:uncharacterized membrane protein
LKKQRIESIDALRGLAVALMVVHHALFDAVEFLGAPAWLFSNPVFDVLHYTFAGVFVFLAGVSSRFSRSNIKRGLITALAALAVSAATWYIGAPVRFGVLHLLASCMLLYGGITLAANKSRLRLRAARGGRDTRATARVAPTYNMERGIEIDRAGNAARKQIVLAAVYLALLVTSALAVKYITPGSPYLWPLGWTTAGFYSSDYFPLFPWLFVFLLGTLAGDPIKARRLPAWFYELKPPFFPALGRRALIVYLLHQPVLYGITLVVLRLL